MANRTVRKSDKSPPRIVTPDETLAYAICFTIYSKGCVCRDQGRANVCKNMLDAAQNARAHIAKERPVTTAERRPSETETKGD